MVAQGYSNPQAARMLGITESTLKNHLNAIYKGGGVVNRRELVDACRNGNLGVRRNDDPYR